MDRPLVYCEWRWMDLLFIVSEDGWTTCYCEWGWMDHLFIVRMDGPHVFIVSEDGSLLYCAWGWMDHLCIVHEDGWIDHLCIVHEDGWTDHLLLCMRMDRPLVYCEWEAWRTVIHDYFKLMYNLHSNLTAIATQNHHHIEAVTIIRHGHLDKIQQSHSD